MNAVISPQIIDTNVLRKKFNAYLNANKPKGNPEYLYEAANHILKTGGKRIRPNLLIQSGVSFGAKIENLLPAALAIEFYHNSTLIHDDIMDKAQLRRGEITTHELFNVNTAINAGNLLITLGFKQLQFYSGKTLEKLLELYNKTCTEIIEGQGYDLDFEERHEVSATAYIEMIRLKTSVLLAASAQMGAIIAGADKSDCAHIYEFALNLGISFQIKDDYLDTFGDQDSFGKKIGGDILLNKKTLLLIYARQMGNTIQVKKLNELNKCVDASKKIEETTRLYIATGAREKVEREMCSYYQRACSALERIKSDHFSKKLLFDFAESVYGRSH